MFGDFGLICQFVRFLFKFFHT